MKCDFILMYHRSETMGKDDWSLKNYQRAAKVFEIFIQRHQSKAKIASDESVACIFE